MGVFNVSPFNRATLPVQETESSHMCDVHTIPSSPTSSDVAFNGSPRRHSSVDEIFGLVNSMSVNGQRQRSLSDSSRHERNINGKKICLRDLWEYKKVLYFRNRYGN